MEQAGTAPAGIELSFSGNVFASSASWLGLDGQRPDLVVRFGRGPKMPASLRRPVDTVLV